MKLKDRFDYRLRQLINTVDQGCDRISGIFNGVAEDRLENGTRVKLRIEPKQSVASLKVTIGSGAEHDPPGQEGIGHLLEHVLSMDLRHKPCGVKIFNQQGGRISAATSPKGAEYIFEHIAADISFSELARMALEVVFNTDFDASKIEKEKTVIAQEIVGAKEKHADSTALLLRRTAFGQTDENLPTIGSQEALSGITVEDLKNFHRLHYIAENATIEFIGPIVGWDLRGSIKKIFGNLPGGAFPQKPPKPAYIGGYREAHSQNPENVKLGTAFPYPPKKSSLDFIKANILTHYLSYALHDRLRSESDPVSYDMMADIEDDLLMIAAGAHQKHSHHLQQAVIDILGEIANGRIDPVRYRKAVAAIQFSELKYKDHVQKNGFISPYMLEKYLKETKETCKKIRPEDLSEIVRNVLKSADPTIVVMGDKARLLSYDDYAAALKQIVKADNMPVFQPAPFLHA